MNENIDIAKVAIGMMEEDCAHDQPCKFGFRCGSHAVYCENHEWEDKPRKCRRTWYTGGEEKDEDCKGYKANLKRQDDE